METETATIVQNTEEHLLSDKWILWAHLPHDTDWSLKSYIKIVELDSVEKVISLCNSIPEKMIKNCMLFLMRKNINPTWEDNKNCKGGCFSFKVINKNVYTVWNDCIKALTGGSISDNNNFYNCITGITISPKKSFCILKFWMTNLEFQNPKEIHERSGLSSHGCLFKKHNPNY